MLVGDIDDDDDDVDSAGGGGGDIDWDFSKIDVEIMQPAIPSAPSPRRGFRPNRSATKMRKNRQLRTLRAPKIPVRRRVRECVAASAFDCSSPVPEPALGAPTRSPKNWGPK